MEEELSRQAALHGLDVGLYAVTLLEGVASKAHTAPTSEKNMVELFAPLRGLDLDFERDRDLGRDISL